jgi:lipopolysaccharide/colanic/teichoic acid biosynthesis glycosyltransferase
MYRLYLKRPLDILIAGTGLIVLSPVLLLTALAIRLEDGVPAFFGSVGWAVTDLCSLSSSSAACR